MPHIFQFDSIENFRDLGGYPCAYGQTEPHIVFRSATPANLSSADLEEILALGIRSVIDLREEVSKKDYPSPYLGKDGLQVISLNVNGNGRIPKDYDDQISSYFEMVEDPESARKIFKAILRSPKPMLIHCNAGKDRTGMFVALLLLFNGVSLEDVNRDYLLSFELLPKMAKEARAKNLPPILIDPTPEFLPDFMGRFLDRYGSFADYCEAIGLSEDEFVGLSNTLGKQELSCGAVVFHDGRLLVEHMAEGHYSLPKGHKEKEDADDYATAKREIKEETGLLVSFVPGFSMTTAYSPKPGRFKEVRWFIAETSLPEMKLQKEEVQDAYWLKPDDAMMVLSHDDDRSVAMAACRFYLTD